MILDIPDNATHKDNSNNIGLIAGISVTAVVLILVLFIFCLVMSHCKKKDVRITGTSPQPGKFLNSVYLYCEVTINVI